MHPDSDEHRGQLAGSALYLPAAGQGSLGAADAAKLDKGPVI